MTKKPRNPADYVIGDDVEVSDVDLKQEEVYVDGERLTDERVDRWLQSRCGWRANEKPT
ncbi:CopG family DNA-binding protein [Mycobacterium tuberculosis]|nr:CopG family DNA-binding protein [Mycobacterium tuberculosis]